VTNASGAETGRMGYYPFGETRYSTGTMPTDHQYTGQQQNSYIKLMNYRSRWYDHYLNQFIQPDSIIPDQYDPQSLNRYAYARGNPILYNDPTGHWPNWGGVWNSITTAVTSAWNWYTGRDVGYQGSGWGHGPRQVISNLLGGMDEISNLPQTLGASLLQEESVQITGQALDKLASDPALLVFQDEMIAKIQEDPSWYSQETRTDFKHVTFGGPHDWKAAAGNELTWMVRAADVHASISPDKNNDIMISYSFTDTLDLRPSPTRSSDYNAITRWLGFWWHEVYGGNDKLKMNANWQYHYSE
jgi:RHS repeat-associated protein